MSLLHRTLAVTATAAAVALTGAGAAQAVIVGGTDFPVQKPLDDQAQLFLDVNAYRLQHGAGPLAPNGAESERVQAHAQAMYDADAIADALPGQCVGATAAQNNKLNTYDVNAITTLVNGANAPKSFTDALLAPGQSLGVGAVRGNDGRTFFEFQVCQGL